MSFLLPPPGRTWTHAGVLLCLCQRLTGVASHLSQRFPVGPVDTVELFLRGLLSQPGLLLQTQRAEDACLHRLQELLVHHRLTPCGEDQEDQQQAGSEPTGRERAQRGEPAWEGSPSRAAALRMRSVHVVNEILRMLLFIDPGHATPLDSQVSM